MFKCCVCNSASKKASLENADDTPIGSPVDSRLSAQEDDEIKSTATVDKWNGNVQKSEKTSLLEDASVEDKDALLEDKNVSLEAEDVSLEDKNVSLRDKDASIEDKDAVLEDKNVSLKDKDASLEEKGASLEDDVSLEDNDALLEDKETSLEAKDASLEDRDASLEDKDASLEDKDVSRDFTLVRTNSATRSPYCGTPQNGSADVEESSSSTSTKDTVEEAGEETGDRIVRKDDSNLDGVAEDGGDWTEEIDPVVVGPVKTNLYDASGYIERTIDDGPEDEGDDSVFEGENDIKKAPPVATSIPRWLSEEDDGEYVSGGCSGMQEPPATPVARDELALRRHRFFSDLLQAAQNSTEHRVRFDPLGPMVHTGCETTDKEEHLEELVNRLENVTRRLENVHFVVKTQDTAVQTSTPSPKRSASSGSNLSPSPKQETVPDPLTNMSLAGYQDFLAGPVKEYLQLSQKIGGDVAAHSQLVEKAFQIQLQFVQMAASRSAPTNQSEQVSLFAPMSMQIQQIQEFREKNRGSPFFNHLSAISESIPALGWVAVSPTPAPYVKEMNDAGQFYTNRVLKDWKEKNKIHIDWCKAWVQTLTDLQQYVRQHHTTGLVWGKGGSLAGVPPPPPPSMPIGDIPLMVNDDRSALFAQINRGEDITKSLKKVTSDMQTHKNPALRSGPAPFKAPNVNALPMKNVLSASAPIDKPPVFTRDGKKWLVEYHRGENLVIDNAEMNNVVYVFRCQDSTLTVKGKVNSVVMDSCRKSSVVFDSLVSSIEFVNCQSVQMQVLGKVPTISIDKTDGCQMYLSAESLGVELITSKSSEMNVMVPKPNGDYSEYPVPEQFKTTISKNGLSTMAVDSLG
ncbi:PREDICTED: adenylyl cyclase-associated protein 1 [Vollenhovia emeryi]|uniref:adenylyl cyclase-associated protein 1 n=1 Tax=Vollenhovia emeryi TaxID=411798 RepID=UPI0005F37F24|nr:PREDICTED: adenylyl cyclase-associated protein 1 [Vollenhovia emeryi]